MGLGLPKIEINFRTLAGTAVIRSARGKVALILNDANYTDADGVTVFNISDASDMPATGISAKSADLIKKALAGAPSQILALFIPPTTYEEEQEVTTSETVETTTTVDSEVEVATTTQIMSDVTVESDVVVTDPDTGETSTVASEVTVQSEVTIQTTTTIHSDVEVATTTIVTGTTMSMVTVTATVTVADALSELADRKINYIAYPTGDADGQERLASFVTNQRKSRHKTLKAVVANYAADSYSVINFTTGGIKVDNPEYVEALEAAGGDAALVDANIPKYLTYTAAEYTARIAGIAAGIALDRSMTYFTLPEVVSCSKYADIDAAIDAGQLVLFDEGDGNGVKIGRGINSYVNFSASEGEDLRFIKIVESIDLIKDDIAADFKANYVGKVVNDYDHKLFYIGAINTYLQGLIGSVLDGGGTNSVDIDTDANREYARSRGAKVDSLGADMLRSINTGTHVFLKGTLSVVNAMEDLTIEFTL